MEKEGDMQNQSSTPRRSRSEVSPDWTWQDSLILVNEVGAVEVRCKETVTSFQKWRIVAQNCNSLMANRSLAEVRRRWLSLLVDYNKIKQHQEENSSNYWSRIEDGRKEFGLPESFDLELFKAISHVKQIVEDRAVMDPNPEAEAEAKAEAKAVSDEDFIPELGCMKQKNPQQQQQISNQKVGIPQKPRTKRRVNPPPPKEPAQDAEEIKKLLVAKLRENADLINGIVEGNGYGRSKTRQKGDELIDSLGNLTETLDKLHDLLLES